MVCVVYTEWCEVEDECVPLNTQRHYCIHGLGEDGASL